MAAIGGARSTLLQGLPQFIRVLQARISPLALAYGAYVIFGLCLIANSQVDSDGTWYLYGKMLHRGVKLYTDLRLPQQPLFILVTAWWQPLLGNSWLLSLLPPVLSLFAFTHGFYLLARRSNWWPWQQAIVFLGSACVAIAWNSYRFDDYRILSDIIGLYTTVLLLRLLGRTGAAAVPPIWSLVLGVLAGLSFTTRANDGLLLLISVAVVLFHAFRGQRVRQLLLLAGGFVVTSLAVVLATGDSLQAYFRYTLLVGPASKGGLLQVALSPVMLARDLVGFLTVPLILTYAFIFLTAAAVPVLVARIPAIARGQRPLAIAASALITVFIECLVIAFFNRLSFDCIANVISPVLMVALAALSFWVGLSLLNVVRVDNRMAALFLVPFGAVVASGMSSGGKLLGIHGPIGLFMGIVPTVFTLEHVVTWGRAYTLSVYSLLASSIFVGKVERPLTWEYYQAQPMFVGRAIINHPLYGPMLIDTTVNKFFEGVCRTIRASDAKPELLSLPYSYANYYCGIEPWGMNVQTYFDTSNAETIRKITNDLGRWPPTWVLYQRQLTILRLNETFFNHGRRSPHHDLDQFIEGQVDRGAWEIVSRWSEQPGDDWQLIRTSARHPPPIRFKPAQAATNGRSD